MSRSRILGRATRQAIAWCSLGALAIAPMVADAADTADHIAAATDVTAPAAITVEVLAPSWPEATEAERVEIRAAVEAHLERAEGEVLAETPSGLLLIAGSKRLVLALREDPDLQVRDPLALDARPQRFDSGPDSGTATREQREPEITALAATHVTVTGADAWHAAGLTGRGVRVGVVDFFHVPRYWNESTMGPRPGRTTHARCIDRGRDCIAEFFDGSARTGDEHGPAVVEILRDMAPEVEVFIGRATTESDYYQLVDWFVAQEVTIINRSLGSRFDGPGDGVGAMTAVAEYAASRGILWVNSVGNNGRDRYYRHPVRLIGDFVAFGPTGTDTWLPFFGCASPAGVRWANDWYLPAAQRTDYDALIYDAPIGQPDAGRLIAASRQRQRSGAPPLETFTGQYCPSAGRQLYLRVQRIAGTPEGDVLEILDLADGIARHTQAPYSAAVPVADSRAAGVLAIGAIDPPGSGRVADYSAQGPTNDGRSKPDLVAPAGSASVAIGGTFSGTSAAAPVVAGGAALLSQAKLAAGAGPLGDLVRHSVVDRGPRGRDNRFGTGEFRLPPVPTPSTTIGVTSRYVPLPAPTRILDTRPQSAIGPSGLIGDRWPGRIVDLSVSSLIGASAPNATAIAANITLVHSDQPGYVQAFPTGHARLGTFSNLNAHMADQTRPNFAIIPIGADGRISIYAHGGGHLVVDVLGTFVPADDAVRAGRLIALPTARRVLDTRRDGDRQPLRSGQQIAVPLPSGIPAAQIAALVLNVTATQSTGTGFVQALPAGRDRDIGRTSTLNLVPGLTAANTVILPVTAAGARLYAQLGPGGSAHVIADVTGYITSAAAPESTRGRFVPVAPGRSLDTRRTSAALLPGATVDARARATPNLVLPSAVTAIAWNLTVTGTSQEGYLRAWAAGATEPPTSAMNWVAPSVTLANAAILAPNADGVLRVRAVAGGPVPPGSPLTHVIVDLFGYFT